MTRRQRATCPELLSLENIFCRPQGACPCAMIQPEEGNLVVEDDIEEGAVDV